MSKTFLIFTLSYNKKNFTTMKKPIELDEFQGHIVLYCKGQYVRNETDFFEGLKMIWAIRCGYGYEQTGKDTLIYIANDMFNIINTCLGHRLEHLIGNMHREIVWDIGKPENLSPIEAIIWEYRCIISNMQIREKPEGYKRYQWIVKLPKSKPRLFNKILKGKGEYNDYYKIVKKKVA